MFGLRPSQKSSRWPSVIRRWSLIVSRSILLGHDYPLVTASLQAQGNSTVWKLKPERGKPTNVTSSDR